MVSRFHDSELRRTSSFVSDTEALTEENEIEISIGGQLHRTRISTLLSKPDTKLFQLATEHMALTEDEREMHPSYFFDRNPEVFSSILEYYRTGELHVPSSVCSTITQREFHFWGVNESLVEPCCFVNYYTQINNQLTLARITSLSEDELWELNKLKTLQGWQRGRLLVWRFCVRPNSSLGALIYSLITLLYVLISVTAYCIATLPDYRVPIQLPPDCPKTTGDQPVKALHIVEMICIIFLSVEWTIRLCCAPRLKQFFRNPLTIIDFLSIIPFYTVLIAKAVSHCTDVGSYDIIQILRVVRIFRVYHVLFQFKPMQILVRAVLDSGYELLVIFVALMGCVLFYASLIYYTELRVTNSMFYDIPIGFWYAIITMTTVGYGDFYPISAWGYVVGSLCAITGIFLLALTIPTVSSNFTLYYTHTRAMDTASALQKLSGVIDRLAARRRSGRKSGRKTGDQSVAANNDPDNVGGENPTDDVSSTAVPAKKKNLFAKKEKKVTPPAVVVTDDTPASDANKTTSNSADIDGDLDPRFEKTLEESEQLAKSEFLTNRGNSTTSSLRPKSRSKSRRTSSTV